MSGAPAGGAFDFIRLTPDARGYLPLGGRTVLALRTRLGVGYPTRGELPISERYFAGGASSQRGFVERHLSPFTTGADGSSAPIGGQALLETSAEARIDLFRTGIGWIRAVVFFDGADATLTRAGLDPLHLHWAAGLGLRVQTPAGPVRLDYGYRLNRTGAGDPDGHGDHYALFIAIGEAF